METGYLFPKLGQKPWSPPNTPPQPQVHHHLRGHCHPHKCMHTQTHSGTHTCTHTATGLVELLSFYPSCPVSAADPSSSSPPHGKGTDLSTLQCSPFPCCPPWCKPGLSCGGGVGLELRRCCWTEQNFRLASVVYGTHDLQTCGVAS